MTMKITIEKETSRAPLSVMGKYAGECWGSDISDVEANRKRGISCLADGHGRVSEFPQIYVKIEGFSARFCRELYTHIGGSPTRMQASTRYIDYQSGFDYIVPDKIKADENAAEIYGDTMKSILDGMQRLKDLGIPKEDIANLLPLGMESTMVLRTNLRMLIDMSKQRLCSRAYWEFRAFMKLLIKELSEYDADYSYICDNFFGPKCDFLGYCPESHSCGRWDKGSSKKMTPQKK